MTSKSQASDAYTVALARSNRTHDSLAMVAITILYYDYALTLPREIEHFWKRAQFSLAALLFVINRYLGLFGSVLIAIEYFLHFTPHRCRQLQTFHAYYTVFSQVVVGMLLMIRTYALYNRSRRLVISFVIVGVTLFSATLLSVSINTPKQPYRSISMSGSLGCDLSVNEQLGLRTAVGWVAMICVDTTIFVLTMLKAIKMAPFLHHRVLAVLFRDGAVYYVVMAVANLGNLLNLVLPNIGDTNRGLLTTFTNALCTTITSRILLNLRDPELVGGTLAIGRWSIHGTSSQMGVTHSMAFMQLTTATNTIERTEEADTESYVRISDHVTISVQPRLPPHASEMRREDAQC